MLGAALGDALGVLVDGEVLGLDVEDRLGAVVDGLEGFDVVVVVVSRR